MSSDFAPPYSGEVSMRRAAIVKKNAGVEAADGMRRKSRARTTMAIVARSAIVAMRANWSRRRHHGCRVLNEHEPQPTSDGVGGPPYTVGVTSFRSIMTT